MTLRFRFLFSQRYNSSTYIAARDKKNSKNRPRVWNLKLQSTRIFKTAIGISLITHNNMNFPLSMLIVFPFFLYFHLILNERRYVLVEKNSFYSRETLEQPNFDALVELQRKIG